MSTEKHAKELALRLECCGINRIHAKGAGSLRPDGRRPYGPLEYHTLYIAAGRCRITEADGSESMAYEGDLVLYRPGEYQQYYFEAGNSSRSLYAHFCGHSADAILGQLGLLHGRILRIGKCREYEELFYEMHREYTLQQPECEHFCAGLLWQLLSVTARRDRLAERNVLSASAAEIHRVLESLPERLHEELSAEILAAECNYSVGYFSHLFKSVTGRAPAAYISLLRLQRAKVRLEQSDAPISSVAREVGFPDQAYFSRFFKKHTGKRPSEYRKIYTF